MDVYDFETKAFLYRKELPNSPSGPIPSAPDQSVNDWFPTEIAIDQTSGVIWFAGKDYRAGESGRPNYGWLFAIDIETWTLKLSVQLAERPAFVMPVNGRIYLAQVNNETNRYTIREINPTTGATLRSSPLDATSFQDLAVSVAAAPGSNYASWAATINWNGADSSPGAVVSPLGIPNLMLYALDIDSPFTSNTALLPQVGMDTTTPSGPWMTFTYRKKSAATDIAYIVQGDGDLSPPWTSLAVDNVNVFQDIADPDPDGDSSCTLVRLRVKYDSTLTPKYFLRLLVAQASK